MPARSRGQGRSPVGVAALRRALTPRAQRSRLPEPPAMAECCRNGGWSYRTVNARSGAVETPPIECRLS
jgi:hypothetical protein